MSARRILIAEDDPGVTHPLHTILTQRGYQVWCARDGAEGLSMAQQVKPDLFILDVMMPHMDGWTLLRTLRSLPEFAITPAIFLTALPVQDTVVDSFRMGGVDYISKPFRFEDVISRVAAMFARQDSIDAALKARARASAPPPAALQSSLDQVGLGSLLSVVELEKRTGILMLTRNQDQGAMWVKDGRVMRARVQGTVSTVGATAVFEMLSWTAGQAEFRNDPVDGPDEMNATITHLLMEGARILDEARHRAGTR
jgi:two-component system OmpR family response regulator